MIFFIKGFLVGLSIAAPIGPVAILCINRILNRGRISGLVSGLGSATSDIISSCIAAFSMALIIDAIKSQQDIIRLVGAVVLVVFGIRLFLSSSAGKKIKEKKHSLFVDYTSAFFLTASNPMSLLAFVAMFAGAQMDFSGFSDAALTVAGVMVASVSWWFFFSKIISVFSSKFSMNVVKYINKTCGALIFLFGIVALISLLIKRF